VETNEFIGRIEAVNRVALVARVTAFLEQRSFVEGSEVSKGDLLYTLEQGPFEADVMAKQAALGQVSALLENANQTLGRQQALLNTPAGQRSNLDSAIAQQRSLAAQKLAAEANLQTSQINLAYTEIHAPIDGKISRTNVTEGNVVGPTTGTLATIVSQDPMYVVFPISSRTVLDLRQRYANHGGFNAVLVKLRLPNGRIYAQDGKLDYIDPTISATRIRPGSGAGCHADRSPWRAASGHIVRSAG
jgi:membrane fusion protein (multidrug efflux system)